MSTIETERLVIRGLVESDRVRFVEMFTDREFTVFAEVDDVESANVRFSRMLALADSVPYAKQTVIDRKTDTIVGYTGVGTVVLDQAKRLEWGWRFMPEARGMGYATEATTALLAVADHHDDGEVLCIVAADNFPSRRVADKVGFRWWQHKTWPNEPTSYDLLLRQVGTGGPALLLPPSSTHDPLD